MKYRSSSGAAARSRALNGIEWAHAEALAFASLLVEGTPVRLTGQDVGRGTFSNRHLVLHDALTGAEFAPVQTLPGALAPLEVFNSPLSECACIGFEYGYATAAPEALVLWEAQYGDFVNGAQVMLDQFIAAGLSKWGVTSRLTLLLPHGYEGSGPEHSSGRVERFLQAAAEGNIRIANCTTPAQYFHLLRRQARWPMLRPLVVMTPKKLLRLPSAGSSLADLTGGKFETVLDDPASNGMRASTRSLLLCSGKVYYDLLEEAKKRGEDRPPIARVEQLYPFAEREIRELLSRYPSLTEVVWVQEEPRNMGPWTFMEQRLSPILPPGVYLRYVGSAGACITVGRLPDGAQHRAGQDRHGSVECRERTGEGWKSLVRRQERPLARGADEGLQRFRPVLAIMEEEDTPGALRHEKGEERSVRFCRVAGATGQDQVVGAVIGGLALPRPDVVQGDRFCGHARAAVRAHGTVSREEPLAMRTIGASGGASKAGTTGAAGVCCGSCGGVVAAES